MTLKRRGDIVMLNSGGPEMCVIKTTLRQAVCTWVDGEGVKQEYAFGHPCLTTLRHERFSVN
jgi:uncharacterized protein YodC (DUF2158 family)